MIKIPGLKLTFFFAAFLLCTLASAQDFKSISDNLNSVQPDSIRAHIKYLADDKLLGRLPNTPGYEMAMDYVISRFKQIGLQPAGENNTYKQKVPFRKARVVKDEVKMVLTTESGTKELAFGSDYVLLPNYEQTKTEVNAPMVFVGYGISEPEFGYDDYAGIDVKGKIVVMVSGTPDKFPSTVKSHTGNRNTRTKTAFAKGAIGIIQRGPPNGVQSTVHTLVNTGVVQLRDEKKETVKFTGTVTQPIFKELVNISEDEMTKILLSLKEGKPSSFELKSSMQVVSSTKYEDFESYNIVGKITGTDKTLKNEYVAYSAHLDHVGVGTPVKGDSIYNGAHDNASGVACVTEVSRIYSSLKKKPKRSLLFVMVVGEEMGLLGSSYFASHPTVPKDKIVCAVNMDMPTLIAPLLSVVPLGAVHSSLMGNVKTAAAYLGIDVEEDPEPEQNRFVRSDQYSFVQEGIPALNIKYGDKMTEPGKKLTEKVKVWRAEVYHQPQDEYAEANFDFEAGKKYVQLAFLIGYQAAQNKQRPTWNKGDFFGNKFASKK
jgi:hypothetical protein